MLHFDHAAAAPIDPIALAAMQEVACAGAGNPESLHALGRRARAALEQAADQVAGWMDVAAASLRWFGSATAALHAALAHALADTRGPVVASAIEHPAVEAMLARAAAQGRAVVRIAMPGGRLDVATAASAIATAEVVVLAPLHHELGTAIELAPLFAIASQAWWVLDAVQAAVWIGPLGPLPERAAIAFSSAKLAGPPGLGVLVVPDAFALRRGEADPFRAPGGLPWLSAVGLGAVCAARNPTAAAVRAAQRALAARLRDGLLAAAPGAVHNGAAGWRGPLVNVSIADRPARELESALDMAGVAVARTSACRLHLDEGSRAVAIAHADEPWRAGTALRWSLGWSTSAAEVDAALAVFTEVCGRPW